MDGEFFSDWWFEKIAGLEIPANYTDDDPLDLAGKEPVFQAMHVDWIDLKPQEQKQAIVNAFRATMLSPRLNLKSNAILYQTLMSVPADESNPDVFEHLVREVKAKWDAYEMRLRAEESGRPYDPADPPERFVRGRYMPGFWGNIRRLANLGPYSDEIHRAAVEDVMQYGASGKHFRTEVLKMKIPGVGAKVASFAWLALAPLQSELATIDVHMMRHFGLQHDAPKNVKEYFALEEQLREERNASPYGDTVPLTKYQWGVWDKRRTPGFHQDHSPLRAYDPTPFDEVDWPVTFKPPRKKKVAPGQQELLPVAKWSKASVPGWVRR
jgi:hypothetical protein